MLSQNSVWATDFDAMALKTCLRLLLSKYGVMSIEMQKAYIEDSADTVSLADEAIENADIVVEADVADVIDETKDDEDATEHHEEG